MSEQLTEQEVGALADVYHDLPKARHFLHRATGMGLGRQPGLNASSAVEFWNAVSSAIEFGAVHDGRRQILMRALADHPGNQVFHTSVALLDPQPDLEIGDDEREVHADVLRRACRAAGCSLPSRWAIADLSALRDVLDGHLGDPGIDSFVVGQALATLRSLIRALKAWELLDRATAVDDVSSGELAHLFWRSLAGDPDQDAVPEQGATLEHLLVRAASVRPNPALKPKSALARFVVSILGHLGVSPAQAAVARWLAKQERTPPADAKRYLDSEQRWWLLVDLGEETTPTSIRWWLYSPDGALRRDTRDASDGFESALRDLMKELKVEQRLMVDVALPAELMTAGVEHWKVRPQGSRFAPLSAECEPRLRYSPRLNNPGAFPRHPAVDDATWVRKPMVLDRALLADSVVLTEWIAANARAEYPYLIADATDCGSDELAWLLDEGLCFVLWLRRADDGAIDKIREIADKRTPDLLRRDLPELIGPADRRTMTVVWDDPDGRGKYSIEHLTSPLRGLR